MAKRKSKKTSSRNKWLIVTGAFIILFAIFYYVLSNRASNWRTYVSPTGLYSVNYLKGWLPQGFLMMNNTKDDKQLTIYPPRTAYDEEDFPDIYVNIWNPNGLDLNSWIKGHFCFSKIENSTYLTQKEVELDKNKALYIKVSKNEFCAQGEMVFSVKNGLIYELETNASTGEYLNIFRQTVSSFRFTK